MKTRGWVVRDNKGRFWAAENSISGWTKLLAKAMVWQIGRPPQMKYWEGDGSLVEIEIRIKAK